MLPMVMFYQLFQSMRAIALSLPGEVPLRLMTNKDGSNETETHGDTPCYEEACIIMEEDPLKYVFKLYY